MYSSHAEPGKRLCRSMWSCQHEASATGGIAMPLRRICKSGTSGDDDDCPAVYLEELPTTAVAQGPLLSPEEMTELQQLGAGEGGVRLPTETLLRAAALILAEHGKPAMLAEVQDFLAEWDPTA
jgi:hypothetical protein